MDIKTISFETYVRTMVGLRAIRTKNTEAGQEKLLTKEWGDHFGGDYSQYIFVIDYDPNFRGYGPKD